MSRTTGYAYVAISPDGFPAAFATPLQARAYAEDQLAYGQQRREPGLRWVTEDQGWDSLRRADRSDTGWIIYHLDVVDTDAPDPDWDDDRDCTDTDEFNGGTVACFLDLGHRGRHEANATVADRSVTVIWGDEDHA